ncbi:hypothetical protein SprV_0301270400 [Sparganum proliferum]
MLPMCGGVTDSTPLEVKDIRSCDSEHKRDAATPHPPHQKSSDATMMTAPYTNPCPQSSWMYALPAPVLPPVPPYNEKENFKTWLRRAKFFLEEVPETEHSRTLLKCLSPEHLDRALDAGLATSTPFNRLCEQLQNILQPKMPVGEAIDRLCKRRCQRHEMPKDFARDLSALVDAAYPTLTVADKEAVILHHFIKGLDMPDLVHSLLVMPASDLQEAVARAERFRLAEKPRWLKQPVPRTSDHQVYRPTNGRLRRPRHTRTSDRCNRNSLQTDFNGASTTSPTALERSMNSAVVPICTCSDPHTHLPAFYAEVLVVGRTAKALIDTGATISLVNPQVLPDQLYSNPAKTVNSPHLTTADGSQLLHQGTINLSLRFRQADIDHTFFVTPNLAWDMLLGIDFLSQQDCVINVRDRTIQFGQGPSQTAGFPCSTKC